MGAQNGSNYREDLTEGASFHVKSSEKWYIMGSKELKYGLEVDAKTRPSQSLNAAESRRMKTSLALILARSARLLDIIASLARIPATLQTVGRTSTFEVDSINVSAQYHPTAWSTSTLSLPNIESLQQLT